MVKTDLFYMIWVLFANWSHLKELVKSTVQAKESFIKS